MKRKNYTFVNERDLPDLTFKLNNNNVKYEVVYLDAFDDDSDNKKVIIIFK